MTLKSILYARVSTEEQGKGYSLPTQVEACRNFAHMKGYEVVGEFTDMHTGTELDRPGLNKVYDCINIESANFLVVYDIDRLSREVSLQAIIEMEMAKLGVRINYVIGNYEDTPEGDLLKLVKSGIAQYENRNRVERCRRGKIGKAKAGNIVCPSGRAPFGYIYKQEGRKSWFEIEEAQADIVRRMYAWLVNDGFSSYAIAKLLWERGILSKGDCSAVVYKKGGYAEWSPSTVRRIISNSVYLGIWYYNKTRSKKINGKRVTNRLPESEWIPVKVPAIIDEWLWNRAQVALANNRQRALRNTRKQYLLRSIVFCPCGRRWTVVYKTHLKRAYYRCPTNEAEHWRARCVNNFSIRQEVLENAVWTKLFELFTNIDNLKTQMDTQAIMYSKTVEQKEVRIKELKIGIENLDKKLGYLLDQLMNGSFIDEVIEPRRKNAMQERTDLEREIRILQNELKQPPINLEQSKIIAHSALIIGLQMADMVFERKRKLIEQLDMKISIIDKNQALLSGNFSDVLIATTSPAGSWLGRLMCPERG